MTHKGILKILKTIKKNQLTIFLKKLNKMTLKI